MNADLGVERRKRKRSECRFIHRAAELERREIRFRQGAAEEQEEGERMQIQATSGGGGSGENADLGGERRRRSECRFRRRASKAEAQ